MEQDNHHPVFKVLKCPTFFSQKVGSYNIRKLVLFGILQCNCDDILKRKLELWCYINHEMKDSISGEEVVKALADIVELAIDMHKNVEE